MSDGRIPWPRKYGFKGLIIFADLLKALKRESVQAVAWHWSVSPRTVARWKQILGLREVTPGTLQTIKRSRAEALRIRRNPQLRKGAKPISTRELLRIRPTDPAEVRGLQERGFFARAWTKPELKLLGTASDKEVARELGRTVMAVRLRRTLLGLPAVGQIQKAWTLHDHKLLGLLPDEEVAKLTGRTPEAVEARRITYHIRRSNPKVRVWTKDELKLLGKMPDPEVAKLLNRPVKGVRSRRVKARKLFAIRRNLAAWEIQLLGTMPDAKLAKKLGRTVVSVGNSRRKRGIPPTSGKTGGRKWTPAELKLLGTLPDEELARKTGRSPKSIQIARFKRKLENPGAQRRKWTTEEDRLIKAGLPVLEIATLTGRTRGAVKERHRDLGIPNPDRRFWKPEEVNLLGKISDEEIAKRFGFTMKQVMKKRLRMGK